jgi:signal transduction histidine kinase
VDGGKRWIRCDLVAHEEDDGSVVWSGYWADASIEHARADELARARDTAEAASRAKDDFLAMMSHEIRTPMNGVLGLVEVFENTPLSADQAQMLGMIQDSASALLQILDDLLDYSKIEAGRLSIESTLSACSPARHTKRVCGFASTSHPKWRRACGVTASGCVR